MKKKNVAGINMQKVCSITPKIIFPFGSKQGVVRYMTIKVKIVVCVVIF